MKKKYSKIIVMIVISLFVSITPCFAIEFTVDELGEEIDRINPNATTAFIIGEYVFTSEHLLTTQDVMLAARTISVSENAGSIDKDAIYGEMTIQRLEAQYDDNYDKTGWISTDNVIGTTQLPEKINISYIDYEETKEIVKYTVTFDNDGTLSTSSVKEGLVVSKPEDPVKDGYKFIGWYNGNEEHDFTKPVTEDITLTAKYVSYDTSLIEAEEKTYSVNSGIIQTHEVFSVNETTIDNSLLIKFSKLTNTIYIHMRSLVTGEEPTDEILEMYEVVKDNKSYIYYKMIDEETQKEVWYYNIETIDNSDSSVTNYKSIEKITSDIEGQDKYKFTLDKDDYVNDNNLKLDFKSDIVGYAYVKDGYLIKIFIDYKESLSEIDKNECEEYTTTTTYSGLNENDEFSIPQEIIDKAILVE